MWLLKYIYIFNFLAIQGDENTDTNLDDLPEEIIEMILMDPNLSYRDLKRTRLTSKRLEKIADAAIEKRDRKCKSWKKDYILIRLAHTHRMHNDVIG